MHVAVIGAGAMGSATAWRLARRGVDVTCFDRYSPPHAMGSSHGESRIFRTAYMEGEWYVPLLQESLGLWRELEAETGAHLLTLTGALMIGPAAGAAVAGALQSATAHHLDARLLGADELAGFQGIVSGPEDVALLDAQAGFVRPEAAVEAMLSRVPDVRRDSPVLSLDTVLDGFDAVVVAAGPWTSELLPRLPLKVERQVLAWFALEPGADWFTPKRFPVFIRETQDAGDVYGFPTLDGVSIKIARHHYGAATDPDHVERVVLDAELEPLRLFVARHLRGVSDRVTRTVTCMYTNTPDENFIVDRYPDDPRIILISACSGHGFKFAPVIGDIAADLVCEGATRRDISHFALSRFAAGTA